MDELPATLPHILLMSKSSHSPLPCSGFERRRAPPPILALARRRHAGQAPELLMVTLRAADVTALSLGGFVIRIRILMYCDVSCVYPEGYMYPSCILMYLKCILNALLHSKRIHVS